MIDGLTIVPLYGEPLALSVPEARDGYLVKNIEGLSPVAVTISSTPQALMDGEVYQASRREKRTIVLTIKLDLNYSGSSVEARRNRLHFIGSHKEMIRLEFDTTEIDPVYIEGYIEDVSSPIFSDNPTMSLTIVCLDPDFKSIEERSFEDEVANVSHPIDYRGTLPSGLQVRLHSLSSSGNGDPQIETWRGAGALVRTGNISFTAPFSQGTHSWIISSIPGNKGAWRSDGGTGTFLNLANFDHLVWPTFYPGENELKVSSNLPIVGSWDFTATWQDRYGAI